MSKNTIFGGLDVTEADLKPIGEPLVDTKGLEPWSFNDITHKVVMTMLVRMYEFNPELQDKISDVFNTLTGGDFSHYREYAKIDSHRLPASVFLHGPPGHGKSSVPRKVAEVLCEHLGLNLVTKFEKGYIPAPNDFVMPVIEMSNETSNLMVGGIPIVAEQELSRLQPDGTYTTEKVEQMERALFQLFDVARQASYGMVILDDVSNLPRKLQNIMLSLLEESRFQSTNFGRDKLFFATGNLGAADGSIAQRISSATGNRVLNCYLESSAVLDTVPYMQTKHMNSELLDCGLSAYATFVENALQLNPYESSAKNSSHMCPRTLDHMADLMPRILDEFHYLDSRSGDDELLEFKSVLKEEIASIAGFEQDMALANFIGDYAVNHQPTARDFVRGENHSAKLVKQETDKMGALKGTALIEHQLKLSDAVLGHYFDRVLRKKDISSMDQDERNKFHAHISTLFESLGAETKAFAKTRVENSVPAIMREISGGTVQPATVSRIVDRFTDVVSGAFAEKVREEEKARKREKGKNKDAAPEQNA